MSTDIATAPVTVPPAAMKPTVQWMRAVRIRTGQPELTTTTEKPGIDLNSSQVLVKVKGTCSCCLMAFSLILAV